MAEPTSSELNPVKDGDFDPTAEMLVNDFDDERTLEEEEAMESSEDVQNELDDLQKEGDMPIEELLSMYGYGDGNQAENTQSSSSEEILSNQDLTLDKEEIGGDFLQIDDQVTKEMSDLLDCVDTSTSTSRLLRSAVSHHQSESESDTDNEDYIPDEDDDWKKTIQVGSDYQAIIPEGLCKYDGAPAYENDDKMLWDPSKISDNEIESYLKRWQQSANNCLQGVNAIPTGFHVRDDEQALYLLLQCGHSVDEAMRRRRMQPVSATDTMSLWSEEECCSFENGLRNYGKDFHLIQQNKVRTRSVGELVQFYYLWKKTERHDVFANKTRLEKKKYSLHPGTTDYMDRFLDDQENPSPHRDRSSSPSVHSLISGDHKRQHHNRTPPSNTNYNDDHSNHTLNYHHRRNSGSSSAAVPTIEEPSNANSDASSHLPNAGGNVSGEEHISTSNFYRNSNSNLVHTSQMKGGVDDSTNRSQNTVGKIVSSREVNNCEVDVVCLPSVILNKTDVKVDINTILDTSRFRDGEAVIQNFR
ncbi:hypothetical protein CHUAL_004822 [Chamberlinius hualienensis]